MKNNSDFSFNYSIYELNDYAEYASSLGTYRDAIIYLDSCKDRLDNIPEGNNYQIIKNLIYKHFSCKNKYLPINNEFDINTDCKKGIVRWNWLPLQDEEKTNWLCSELGIAPGAVQLLCSYANTGKSIFAACFAACVSNNLMFLNKFKINDPGPCLWLDFEQGESTTRKLYRKVCEGLDLNSYGLFNYLDPEWKLDNKNIKEELKILKDHKLCIIDPFLSAVYDDVNDDKIRKYIDLLSEMSEIYNCSILLLHHEGKTKLSNNLYAAKGSSSIISAVGGSWHLHKDDPSSTIVHFQMGKIRDVDKYISFDYEQVKCGEFVESWERLSKIKLTLLDKEPDKTNDENIKINLLKIINENEGIGKTDLGKKCNLDNKKLYSITNILEKLLLIKTKGKNPKKHYITEEGKNQISWNI
jgi:predicted transcriptional regulator